MFIAIINFPIKPDKANEFIEWFNLSSKKFENHKGLIRRRLLKPLNDGPFIMIIEHESEETFAAGHSHPDHIEAENQLPPLLNGIPKPQFYDIVS